MAQYTVTDPQSGKSATLTGDSPPTESELNDIFSQIGSVHDAAAQPQAQSIGHQLADSTANAAPIAGMIGGAEMALPFAPAAGPLAPLVPVAGAAIGAMGGAGFKSIYNQLVNGQQTSSGQVAQDISGAGKDAALGQMAGTLISPYVVKGAIGGTVAAPAVGDVSEKLIPGDRLGGVAGAINNAAVRFGKQFAGIHENVGRYVLGRGTDQVLTHDNMVPGAADTALESAQSFLSRIRNNAGQAVGAAEDAINASGESGKMFDTTGMAANLRSRMAAAGIAPESSTVGLASGKGMGILKEAQALLDKGKLSGSELINVKRLLDSSVEYSGAGLPEVNSLQEALIKGVAGDARAATNSAFPDLAEANSGAHEAFGIFDKYRQGLNTSPIGSEAKADADTLRRLRTALNSAPASVPEMAADFEKAAEPGGRQVVNSLFDTIAAQHYTPDSPVLISPSSPLLKAASTVGLTGPQIAGAALRASSTAAEAVKASALAGVPFVSPAAAKAFSIMSPESIAAYYRSPGGH